MLPPIRCPNAASTAYSEQTTTGANTREKRTESRILFAPIALDAGQQGCAPARKEQRTERRDRKLPKTLLQRAVPVEPRCREGVEPPR